MYAHFWILFVLAKTNKGNFTIAYKLKFASNVFLAKSCENAVAPKGDNLLVGIIPNPYWSSLRDGCAFLRNTEKQVIYGTMVLLFLFLHKRTFRHTMPDSGNAWIRSAKNTTIFADWRGAWSRAACLIWLTSPGCPSACCLHAARNADKKPAGTPGKMGSTARRSNAAIWGDLQSECRICTQCSDRYAKQQHRNIAPFQG